MNVAVWAVANAVRTLCHTDPLPWLALSWPSPHWWTFASYMFTQVSPGQLAFNMLWLYLLGRALPGAWLYSSYLTGGVAGGMACVGAYGLDIIAGGCLTGASAATLGAAACAAVTVGNHMLRFPLLGTVRLRTVSLLLVAFSMLAALTGNMPGAIAHLAGAAAGAAAGCICTWAGKKHNNDITLIISKMKRSGFESLSQRQREQLIKSAKK